MRHGWKQHEQNMIRECSRVPVRVAACVGSFVAGPVGRWMCGGIKAGNDITSRFLTCSGLDEFHAGRSCVDHGGMSRVCAFGDVPRIRGISPITQLQFAQDGREQHPQFRLAQRPAELCRHRPDSRCPT